MSESEKLGDEITELCGYIYAATYHLLELIREFDEKRYWADLGFQSCAHWLNFRCGFGMNSARERLRVAHGTAHHVERLVAQYRRAKKLEDAEFAMDQYQKREVTSYYDHDGCLMMKAKIPADQGELIVKALEMAMEEDVGARLADDTPHLDNGPHVTAETSRRIACDCCTTTINEDQNGEPLSIGSSSRRRRGQALRNRLPGCTGNMPVRTLTANLAPRSGTRVKRWSGITPFH